MADDNRRMTHVAKNDEIRYGVEYPDDPLVKQPEVQTQIMEQFFKQSNAVANLRHNAQLLGERLNQVMRPQMPEGDSGNSIPRPNNVAPLASLLEDNNIALSSINDMLVDLLQRLEL